jgi:thymidylate kinase
MLRISGKSAEILNELKWLLGENNIFKSLSLLKRYCSVVSETLFLECVTAINENRPFLRRFMLARQIRRRLDNFKTHSFFNRLGAYVYLILAKLRCRLNGNVRNKKLERGGVIIAFVGADATGKSTLVSETQRWLGKIFAVRKVHVGKPPATALTLPLYLLLPLMRRMLPGLRRSRIQSIQRDEKAPPDSNKVVSSFFYAIRAAGLARDRYKLLKKVFRARTKGEIIICDRYPSELTGAMDSPRLVEKKAEGGIKTALYNRLVQLESALYNKMQSPDIVIKLSVSLETAKTRNRERIKAEKDTDEFIEVRHQNAHNWHKQGTEYIFEVNTDQPLPATLLKIKKLIWESL